MFAAPEADVDQGIHPSIPRQADAIRAFGPANHADAGLWLCGDL